MENLIQQEKECFLTGRTDNLQKHHVFLGRNRNKSEQWGCWCWLTMDWHTGFEGVHSHPERLQGLQRCYQNAFEQKYSHELFMQEFGRNYL